MTCSFFRMPPGVKIIKWPHQQEPTEDAVRREMEQYGFQVYDLQTIPGWFERSRHAHDYDEIRGAVRGVTTFHFDDGPVTIEAGDILIIPGGTAHEVRSHNGNSFSAFKGSPGGKRSVTELGDGKGSVEWLAGTNSTDQTG
ncbi:MAG: cupin domain-containing protein [Leptospiraceae bacterium]|nr:cupin domain-containing protein [Leptospiraceae bacterium]